MNPDQQLDLLFDRARKAPPVESDDFGFETRLLARVRAEQAASWLGVGWRLSPVFVGAVMAAGTWYYLSIGADLNPPDTLEAARSSGVSAVVAWMPHSSR